MKKLLTTTLILITSILTFSCSSKIDGPQKSNPKITAANFKNIGILHNKLLGKSYNYLNKASNIKQGEKGLKSYLIKQVRSIKGYSKKSGQEGAEYINDHFDFTHPKKNQLTTSLAQANESSSEFSPKVKKYLGKLNNLLDNSQNSSPVQNISAMENDIKDNSELTDKQLIVIYSATETAKYSFQYWKENLDKWKELKNNSQKTIANDSKIIDHIPTSWWGDAWNEVKSLAKADAAGAAGAAVGAAVVNAIPVEGQVAYGSAIAGGAAGSSVEAGINDL